MVIVTEHSEERTTAVKTTQGEEEARVDITQQAETSGLAVMHETVLTQGRRKYQFRGEDMGLMIHTKQSVGWPKKDDFTR